MDQLEVKVASPLLDIECRGIAQGRRADGIKSNKGQEVYLFLTLMCSHLPSPTPPSSPFTYIHLYVHLYLLSPYCNFSAVQNKTFVSTKYSLLPPQKSMKFCKAVHYLPGTYLIVERPEIKGASVPYGQRLDIDYFSSSISSFLEINSSSLY